MPIVLIDALSPSILVLSMVMPIIAGYLGKRLSLSIALGWSLFVLGFLFQDIFSVLLAGHFHGQDGVKAVAVDQPGTAAAFFIGWIIPTIGHFVGNGAARLRKWLFRADCKNSSEQTDGPLSSESAPCASTDEVSS